MYNLIYNPTGSVVMHFDTWREAQEYAGQLIDDGIDLNYHISHSMGNGGKAKLMGEYEIKDFVSRTQPNNFTLNLTPDLKPSKKLQKEPFHNLDEDDTKEVLQHTSTGFLIGELVRRLNEYDGAINQIKDIMGNLKIYNKE